MLFHTNPNVKSICHRVGVGNVCVNVGFARQHVEKASNTTARIALCEKGKLSSRPMASSL